MALDRNITGLELLRTSLGEERVAVVPTQHEDLASVAASAKEITSRYEKIDLLVCNAGITYSPDSVVGSPRMKSVHGNDLAFTVNYLSHFLLVEKLMPCLSASSGRVVHLTSSYHWKVDGSELLPSDNTGGPMAYQSDPAKQSPKHVERSYGNTKLAQLWHSRSITRCESTCACPTWVGTGIAGEDSRGFLESMAFPVQGAGIASAINAMFRTKEELGDALNCDGGRSYVANSRVLEYLPAKGFMASKFCGSLGLRDGIVDLYGFLMLLGQRWTFEEFLIQETSPNSYNDKEGRSAFYEWSLEEVQEWL